MLFRRSRLSELEPARRALAEGEYETAFTLLESAARRPLGRSTQAVYLLHLAAFYALYGEDGRENGEWVLREAVAADPNLGEHPLYRALYWEFAALRGEPAGEIRRALRRINDGGDAADGVARYHAAHALLLIDAPHAAERILERLGELPRYLEWRRWSLLGQIFETLGRWDEAVEAFERAVESCSGAEREPERLSLAGCMLEVGDADGAAAVLAETDEAILTVYELADKRYLEGRAEMDRGNPNRALERFRESLELDDGAPPFDLLYASGQCLVALGEYDEGARRLTEALADAPADQRAYAQHERALALVEAERYDEAETAFAEVLGDPRYPHRADAVADLADLRLRSGDFEAAETLAQQALELGAAGPASLTLGALALEYFRLDDAVAHLEQAASAGSPGDPVWLSAQQMLADVFAQRGSEYAERLLTHARAALAYTDPGNEWRLTLERYAREAERALGGSPRLLN